MDIDSHIAAYAQSIPFDTASFLKLIGIVALCAIVVGLLGRLFFGRRSGLNRAVSSSLGILMLYVLGVALYISGLHFDGLLTSLPFVQVQGDSLAIFAFSQFPFPVICAQVLRMVILAFVMNLLDRWIPRGKNPFTWLLLRCLCLAAATAAQLLIVYLVNTFLPQLFATWAPVALLLILAAMLLLGVLKIFVGLALATVNPLLGGLYTFFFSTLVGKQLSKAVFITALLSLLVYALEQAGWLLILLTGISIPLLLAVMAGLLLLWYVIGHLL